MGNLKNRIYSTSSFQTCVTVSKARRHFQLEILGRQLETHFWNKGKFPNFPGCFLLRNKNINTNRGCSPHLLYLWKKTTDMTLLGNFFFFNQPKVGLFCKNTWSRLLSSLYWCVRITEISSYESFVGYLGYKSLLLIYSLSTHPKVLMYKQKFWRLTCAQFIYHFFYVSAFGILLIKSFSTPPKVQKIVTRNFHQNLNINLPQLSPWFGRKPGFAYGVRQEPKVIFNMYNHFFQSGYRIVSAFARICSTITVIKVPDVHG